MIKPWNEYSQLHPSTQGQRPQSPLCVHPAVGLRVWDRSVFCRLLARLPRWFDSAHAGNCVFGFEVTGGEESVGLQACQRPLSTHCKPVCAALRRTQNQWKLPEGAIDDIREANGPFTTHPPDPPLDLLHTSAKRVLVQWCDVKISPSLPLWLWIYYIYLDIYYYIIIWLICLLPQEKAPLCGGALTACVCGESLEWNAPVSQHAWVVVADITTCSH